jgi:hypothetical protein
VAAERTAWVRDPRDVQLCVRVRDHLGDLTGTVRLGACGAQLVAIC